MTGPEPPVPPQAITAAARVLTRSKHAWIPATSSEEAADHAIAKRMLEAAAPHLEAAARERCAQLEPTTAEVHVDWRMTPAEWAQLREVLHCGAARSPYIQRLQAEGKLDA